MKPLVLLISLFIFSCNTNQRDNTEETKIYSDTSTLYYKGTPLFVFNDNVDRLIARPCFLQDTANRQGGYAYLTTDTFFSARLDFGAMIGTLHIETDDLKKIKRVHGLWTISAQNEKVKQELMDSIRLNFIPNMPQNFLLKEADTVRHKSYIEEFKFYPLPVLDGLEHGYIPKWNFEYEARRPQNGL